MDHVRFELQHLKIDMLQWMKQEALAGSGKRNLRSFCLLLWQFAGFPPNCSSNWSSEKQKLQLLEMAVSVFRNTNPLIQHQQKASRWNRNHKSYIRKNKLPKTENKNLKQSKFKFQRNSLALTYKLLTKSLTWY